MGLYYDGPTNRNDAGAQSWSDDSNEANATMLIARGQGGRFRKRKLGRNSQSQQLAAANTAATTTGRKRYRKSESGGGAAGAGAGAVTEEELCDRFDWPSTVTPRTPYGVPLLLSCLSSYPDKVRRFIETLKPC